MTESVVGVDQFFDSGKLDAQMEGLKLCPEHGEAQLGWVNAAKEINELRQAGFSKEDIVAYAQDNPYLEQMIAFESAATQADRAWEAGPFASKLSNAMRANDPAKVNAVAKEAAASFVQALGQRPELSQVSALLSVFATHILEVQTGLVRPVQQAIVNGIVNRFGVHLLLAADKRTLCGRQDMMLDSRLNYGITEAGKRIALELGHGEGFFC